MKQNKINAGILTVSYVLFIAHGCFIILVPIIMPDTGYKLMILASWMSEWMNGNITVHNIDEFNNSAELHYDIFRSPARDLINEVSTR